jgi:hypothetical protein
VPVWDTRTSFDVHTAELLKTRTGYGVSAQAVHGLEARGHGRSCGGLLTSQIAEGFCPYVAAGLCRLHQVRGWSDETLVDEAPSNTGNAAERSGDRMIGFRVVVGCVLAGR